MKVKLQKINTNEQCKLVVRVIALRLLMFIQAIMYNVVFVERSDISLM